ncbi:MULTISPECIES: hypothetical protein [Alkalihalophilus]|uniref:Uncharacterized protein n=2 Tax=Alkalihalophilus pseudofirmus TaxID=79885 RepID=D3FVP6_ALKPO|nr:MULTISPECIES: hypothetical protein [Alkalihalophilus]ADC48561.1 hypothetical protein BpOF4_02470 [Alkalihalophilus pseudofirmus OF4]MDV2885740.1 hypothetical protein [Alkalihalophilus pseudofirmus]MEC2071549.1 hypothetical protein [Alkalihalophilus marmarensis]MED1600943.1 hypothetical protein [Alkalihalophilus marmarensis]OLS39582.1 hypothetical protein BTR22_01550 [Alkalihalophilus pseudofirmus]
MEFQANRMKKLIEHDRFLMSAYRDLLESNLHVKPMNEDAALHYLFKVYVQSEPILLNAYNHLTND